MRRSWANLPAMTCRKKCAVKLLFFARKAELNAEKTVNVRFVDFFARHVHKTRHLNQILTLIRYARHDKHWAGRLNTGEDFEG